MQKKTELEQEKAELKQRNYALNQLTQRLLDEGKVQELRSTSKNVLIRAGRWIFLFCTYFSKNKKKT